MAGVGAAAATGGSPDADTLARLRRVANTAPLEPEPYLVQAALDSRAGKYERAERLLMHARRLNPRAPAARYLLADVWLREGKIVPALEEMAVLSRLLPGTTVQLAPALAEYARTPGARDKLAPIVARNPRLKGPLLTALAADPANAQLVLALAGPDARSSEPEMRVWQEQLLQGLLKRNQYQQAHALWRKMTAVPVDQDALLFNGSFAQVASPPPFNWKFYSGPAGLTESNNGRLRVLFYGRQPATLASQTLVLPPGVYRLRAPVTGSAARGAIFWTLKCLPAGTELMRIDATSGGREFTVPSGCSAQSLELAGEIQDMSNETDIQVGPATIERVGG